MTSTALARHPLAPVPWYEVLRQQDGVLARRQARSGGMSEDAWQWRLDSRRWRTLVPGVALAHSGPATPSQLAWAAVLCGGCGAALAGDAALAEWGMRTAATARLNVAVPEGRTVVARWLRTGAEQDVRVVPHQVRSLERLVLPSSCPPRLRVAPAVLYAAAWAATDRAAEWRVAASVQQRLVRPSDLRRQAEQLPGLRRRRLITSVLDDVELGAHAASELDFLRFLRRAGLPAPDRLQRPVRANGLRYVDAWWERQRVAAELDGAHHRLVAEWEADVLRANQVVVDERRDRMLLLRFTTGNLRHDGPLVAAQLAAVLR